MTCAHLISSRHIGREKYDIDFSRYNMVDFNRSAPRRLKASLEDILEQAGMRRHACLIL